MENKMLFSFPFAFGAVFCAMALYCWDDLRIEWVIVLSLLIPICLVTVWAIHLPPADGEGIANNPGNF